MKQQLIAIFFSLIMGSVHANPYIEMKNELPFLDMEYKDRDPITHYRLGYKWDNNMYAEFGHMTGGTSYEMGYKFDKGNWTFKGKLEGKDRNNANFINNKIQTEIRYTFGE